MAQRQSAVVQQKKFYNLQGVVLGARGVGKNTILEAISGNHVSRKVVLLDIATNLEFIFEFIVNPTDPISMNDYLCFLLIYDITSRDSFDIVCNLFLEQYAPCINKSFQFILLLGNKCDLGHRREVQCDEAENFAAQHSMIYVEASAPTSKNVEYLQKLIRVRATQTMKKLQIEPTIDTPQIQENFKETDNNTEGSVESDSLNKRSYGKSSDQTTPPQFPPRTQQSSDVKNGSTPPPQLPDRQLFSPLNKIQGAKKETKSQATTKNERKLTHEGAFDPQDSSHDQFKTVSPKKKECSLFSDLVQRPSHSPNVNKNLGPKFKAVKKQPSDDSDEKRLIKKHKKQLSSPEPIKIQSRATSPIENQDYDEVEKEIHSLEDSLQQLSHQIELKQKNLQDRDNNDIMNFTDVSPNQTQRHFIKQEDAYVPVVDTFLYDQKQKIDRSLSNRSHSPMITSSLSMQGFTNQGQNRLQTDPRLYSRNLKPIMFLAIENEQDYYIVEVFKDDTLSLLSERVLLQIKSSKRQLSKCMPAILEQEINKFNKQLQSQLQLIEKKKLNQRESLDSYFKHKIDVVRQQISDEKVKNNWSNPKLAIGKIIFAVPTGPNITLYIHQHDDPYDLAFFFILDNDLKKSKVIQITDEITNILKNFKSQTSHVVQPDQTTIKSTYHLQEEEEKFLFKGNFSCGEGKLIQVEIRNGEDVNRCIHKLVLQHNLKYETYMKMVKIINESIARQQTEN